MTSSEEQIEQVVSWERPLLSYRDLQGESARTGSLDTVLSLKLYLGWTD